MAGKAGVRRWHRAGHPPIKFFPPDAPRENEFNRGEVRLMAEAMLAKGRGELVPRVIQDRAMAMLEEMAG